MALTVALLASFEHSFELLEAWDRLAVAAQRPHSAPAWLAAWWQHLSVPGMELSVITVSDGAALIGILPLFARGADYTPLGDGLVPVEPLAARGREAEVGAAFARALAERRPRPRCIAIETQDDSPDWPALIGAGWPGGRPPWQTVERVSPDPRVELGELSFEQWFEEKSSNFRHDVRRKAKRLRKEGGELRLTDAGSLDVDVEAFLRLHLHRHPKGSPLSGDGVGAMLRDVGGELLPSGRFRLASLEVNGELEAALLLSAAGGRVSAWSSGMGERLARHSPVMHLFVEEIERMAGLDERTMDLGPGEYGYKRRLASVEGTLTRTRLFPRGSGHLRSRGRYLLRRGAERAELRARERGGRARRALGGFVGSSDGRR